MLDPLTKKGPVIIVLSIVGKYWLSQVSVGSHLRHRAEVIAMDATDPKLIVTLLCL